MSQQPPIPKSEKCAEQCANSQAVGDGDVCTSLKNLGQTTAAGGGGAGGGGGGGGGGGRPSAKLCMPVSPPPVTALHNFHSLSATCSAIFS